MSRSRGERMICLTSLLNFPRGCTHRPKGLDRLVLASPLLPELFANLRCPLVLTTIKEMVVEVHHG